MECPFGRFKQNIKETLLKEDQQKGKPTTQDESGRCHFEGSRSWQAGALAQRARPVQVSNMNSSWQL